MTNGELEATDRCLDSVYSCKKVAAFENNEIEVFADEILQIQNREAVYRDFYVQVYFSTENLVNQYIFNESALEAAPLNSVANYRTRIQVSKKRKYIWTRVGTPRTHVSPH